MKKVQISHKIGTALILAVTVPLIGLQAWGAPEPVKPATDAVKVNSNVNVNTVAPGASLGGPALNNPVLGGPGSNEQLTPPKLGDPLENVNGPINTGTGALNESIAGDSIQLGGRNVNGNNILLDQNGNLIDGTPKDKMIFNPFAKPENEADPQTGLSPIEESAEAVAQPDPAAGKTPQEEAADALSGGEPSGTGGNGQSGSGTSNGSGTGTTAGGGSGSIFQDPTKGGPGGGVQQAVEAAADRVNNRNINVNEEIVGSPAGNLGNRLQGVDAPRNTNAASFGAFEAGVSPFAAANGGALEVPAGEIANPGVVRSLSAPRGATKTGAASIPLEEGNLPGVVRSGKVTGVNNANLSELEAEGSSRLNPSVGAGKIKVNSGVLPELNETTIRAPRR